MEHSFPVPKVIFISVTFSISLGCLSITHTPSPFTLPAKNVALHVTFSAVNPVFDAFQSATLLPRIITELFWFRFPPYFSVSSSLGLPAPGQAICFIRMETYRIG